MLREDFQDIFDLDQGPVLLPWLAFGRPEVRVPACVPWPPPPTFQHGLVQEGLAREGPTQVEGRNPMRNKSIHIHRKGRD